MGQNNLRWRPSRGWQRGRIVASAGHSHARCCSVPWARLHQGQVPRSGLPEATASAMGETMAPVRILVACLASKLKYEVAAFTLFAS